MKVLRARLGMPNESYFATTFRFIPSPGHLNQKAELPPSLQNISLIQVCSTY